MSAQDPIPSERQQPNIPAEPLSALEAHKAEEEALGRAIQTSESVTETRRKGRVEVESRRVSDEMTRQAREQKAAQRAAGTAPQTPPQEEREQPSEAPTSYLASLPKPRPFNTILVPLDGSVFSERALPFARTLARASGGTIVLSQVVRPLPPHPAGLLDKVVEGITSEPPATSAVHAGTYLAHVRSQLLTVYPNVSTELETSASAGRGLEYLSRRISADIVVIATHARQGVEQRVMGNVGDWLVKHVSAPVLLIPPLMPDIPAGEPMFRRVLVPLDGSLLAEQAIGPAVSVLIGAEQVTDQPTNCELCLLHVAENFTTVHDGREYLQNVKRSLEAQGLFTATRIQTAVEIGVPTTAIPAYAQSGAEVAREGAHAFDLIVMATHGRGGLGRWLYGSVAEAIVPRSTIPVLMVRPAESEM